MMKKRLRVMALLAAVCMLITCTGLNGMPTASAEGFFDFLFGRTEPEMQRETISAVIPAFGEEEVLFESLLPQEDAETPVHSLEMSSVPEVSYYIYTAEVPGAFEVCVTGLTNGEISIYHASEDTLLPFLADESGKLISRAYLEVGDVMYIRLTHSETLEKMPANISVAWLSYHREDAVLDIPVAESTIPKVDDSYELVAPTETPVPKATESCAPNPTLRPSRATPTPPKATETPTCVPNPEVVRPATPTPSPTPPKVTETPTCVPKPEVVRPATPTPLPEATATPTICVPLPSFEPVTEETPALLPSATETPTCVPKPVPVRP